MDKSDLRRKHIQIRQQISEETRQHLSSLIFTKLQKYIDPHHSFGVYISTQHEVDTRHLIEYLFRQGKRVCVPRVTSNGMIFVEIQSLEETSLNKMGILEPTATKPCSDPDVMIVPMLAYNHKGYRLGYGKAYYDGYLRDYHGLKLGICFDFNEDEGLIEENHDVACDLILTNGRDIIIKLDIMMSLGDV